MNLSRYHSQKLAFQSIIALLVITTLILPSAGLSGSQAAPPLPPAQPGSGLAALPLADGPPQPPEDDLLVVRIYYNDQAHLNAIAGELDIWEVNKKEQYAIAAVCSAEYTWLEMSGYRLEVDAQKKGILAPNAPLDPRFYYYDDEYPNANGLYVVDFMQNISTTYPTLTELIDIGDAWEAGHGGYERDILVLRITNEDAAFGDIAEKPVFFLMATIHAREVSVPELAIRYIEYLTAGYNGEGGYGVDPDVTWLVDYNVVYVLVMQNPDGHRMNEGDIGAYRRKNTDNDDGCSTPADWGVDLNRNSSFKWNCCGGSSGNACAETYRGPSRGSEPETQAFESFFATVIPDQNGPNGDDELPPAAPDDATGVFITLHSYSDLVLWPYGFDAGGAPNNAQLRTIGRKFAYFNGYDPSGDIYVVDGATDDWTYGKFGVASYTFEVGPSGDDCGGFFPLYDCIDGINGASRNFWAENGPAFLYAHKIARTPYMTSYGPDAINTSAVPSIIHPGEGVTLTAVIDDTRYNNQGGIEPTQDIAAAEYYIDTPPWETGAAAHAMSAADGGFDATNEDVSAVIDTTGFSSGRHTIFVRGQDADGNWGPVSAVFLRTWSGSEGTALGVLTDAATGTPLAGSVSVDSMSLSTDSDPATGMYTLTIPAGTWNLRASASLHLDQIANNVIISDSAYTTQNFALTPTAGMSITNDLIVSNLNLGDVVQKTLRIENIGNAELSFNTAETEAGFAPAGSKSTSILLVDDDNNAPDMRTYYESALTALGHSYDIFDVGSGSGNGPDAATMDAYDLILWFSGDKYGLNSAGPNDYDEGQLAAYLDNGGALFLSSQEYHYDQGGVTAFMTNYLGVGSMTNDDGNYTSVSGQNDFDGLGAYPLSYPSGLLDYSDAITPGSGQVSFVGNNGKNGGVYTENSVFFAFPWAAIQNDSAVNGEESLHAILNYLAGDIPWLGVEPASGTVAPQGSLDISLTFSATHPIVTQNGTYSGTLTIRGNDPSNPSEDVAIRMIVGAYSRATLVLTKTVDTATAYPGDVVTYTLNHQLVLSSTHNYTQTIFDELPTEISILTDTITMDGTPAPGLYDLAQNAISYTLSGVFTETISNEVIFQAQVDTGLFTGTGVVNTLTGTAIVDRKPTPPSDEDTAAFTVIEHTSDALAQFTKISSTETIIAGGVLSYTLEHHLALTGTHQYTLTIHDPLPGEVDILPGSITLNGVPNPALYDPVTDAISSTLTGVFTGANWIVISFQVQVGKSVITGTEVTNQANINGRVDGLLVYPPGAASAAVGILTPPIQMEQWKTASVETALTSEVFTYTLRQYTALTGTHSYTQNIFDPIPDDVSILTETIRVNGVPNSAIYDPISKSIDHTFSGVFTDTNWITVTFQARVNPDAIPGTIVRNQLSGYVTVDSVHIITPENVSADLRVFAVPQLNLWKTSSVATAEAGEIFAYTLQARLALTGTHAYTLTLTDIIPDEVGILTESIRMNGVPTPALYDSGAGAINLDAAGVFTSLHWVTITFQVQVGEGIIPGTLVTNQLNGAASVSGDPTPPPVMPSATIEIVSPPVYHIFLPLVIRQ